jgi:hypothetical protein
MAVIGIVQIEKTHQEPNTSPLIKVGLVIVVLAWCTILGWAVWSLRGERHADARLYDSGSGVRSLHLHLDAASSNTQTDKKCSF